VASKHPELYRRNDDVGVVVPPLRRYDKLLGRLGVRVVRPWYTDYNPAYDRDDPMPQQHIIALLCQKVGITGTVALRPYLTLTDAEAGRGRLRPRQVAIQSSGMDAKHAMTNKNWSPEGYQDVVSSLRDRYDFVQVGSRVDPALDGALDLRGRTTLRETAAILAGSLAFVGQVGFLMHLARAVDCRSVIVYGGRETPAQSGYPCNENLYSPVHCSPCWRLNTCPYDRMCLQAIGAADVAAALAAQVERFGSPLACDTDTITQEQIDHNAVRHEEALAANHLAWSLLYE
jgi:ADP-heptose:LPS heptosyltransferase